MWELVTSPTRRPQWQFGVVQVNEDVSGGRRGVGTTNHCFHGDNMEAFEEIVDWKPFRYYTIVGRSPFGEMDMTVEFTPQDDSSTRVSLRMRPRGTPEQIATAAQMFGPMEQVMRISLDRAVALAGGSEGGGAPAGE
ncbi:MAG: SRPBCC family protein [Actinomycetota bacterium]|nr:SRPBCC family protein [Actinomycetota bacterium]